MPWYLLPVLVLPLLAQAAVDCRALATHGKRDEANTCYRKLTQTHNPALRAEGFWGLGEYQQANESFKKAVASSPNDAGIRVRWGRLFLERFNAAEAQQLFKEALALDGNHAGALLGMALIASDGYDQKAVEFASKAVEVDPKLVEAQELLARLALEDSNLERAAAEADKALKISNQALDAMAVHASIDLLQEEKGSPWFDQIAKINPNYGEAWALAAHILVLNRRYDEGIAAYRKALELSPDLTKARSQLGINLMRLGLEKEARAQLERAYDAGQQDSATVNSLRLMDSYKNYLTFQTNNTIVKLHRKEADLLRPYIEGELRRGIATFEKKYKIKLDKPVQVEVYPDHEDFAVRTLGMPGLGALGVTFGYVVAMDSPSGRKPGSFHWASTLWHELSHVFVLTATNHRVPRWFTEGMAVHEETAIAPDWGDRLDPEVIKAISGKKLLPVARLDRGFIRPSYPSQVIVSYYQAGRICDYIEKKWGYDKLLDMMYAFAKSTPTAEVIQQQLGMKPEEFDAQFLAWIEAQTKKTVEGYATWRKRMTALADAATAGKNDDVIRAGGELIEIYPDYVEAHSAYELVANAHIAKGEKGPAINVLERYSTIGGKNPAVLKKLAALQEETGRKADAAKTLARINYIYPLDEDLHRRLGDLYMSAGDTPQAIQEYGAVLASKPLDQAASRFNLARALHTARRTEEAKEQLLLALEAAPGYKPAQKLLLELSR